MSSPNIYSLYYFSLNQMMLNLWNVTCRMMASSFKGLWSIHEMKENPPAEPVKFPAIEKERTDLLFWLVLNADLWVIKRGCLICSKKYTCEVTVKVADYSLWDFVNDNGKLFAISRGCSIKKSDANPFVPAEIEERVLTFLTADGNKEIVAVYIHEYRCSGWCLLFQVVNTRSFTTH